MKNYDVLPKKLSFYRKFIEKIKFFNNFYIYPKRQILKKKIIFYDSKTRIFIDKYFLAKQVKIFVNMLKYPTGSLLKWTFELILNGSLIYVAYTGLFYPIHPIHFIIALGLSIWIPTKLISKAYNKIAKDKLERVKAMPGVQLVR